MTWFDLSTSGGHCWIDAELTAKFINQFPSTQHWEHHFHRKHHQPSLSITGKHTQLHRQMNWCWFAAQETCLLIINVKNSCAVCAFFFSEQWIESSKEKHLFEIEIFCSILNVFTVTLIFFFVINNFLCSFFHKQHNIISKIKQNKTADTYSTSQSSIKREGEREGQQEHKSYSFK